jgi:hypothetical protein
MERLTLPLALVFKLSQKFTPTSIMNALGMTCTRHPLNTQILDYDALILGHQSMTELMEKVGACISHAFVQMCQPDALRLTIARLISPSISQLLRKRTHPIFGRYMLSPSTLTLCG